MVSTDGSSPRVLSPLTDVAPSPPTDQPNERRQLNLHPDQQHAGHSGAIVRSFDVFDTCLVRRHLRPNDLIVELASLMLAEGRQPPTGPEAAHELADARIAAARVARERLGGRGFLAWSTSTTRSRPSMHGGSSGSA